MSEAEEEAAFPPLGPWERFIDCRAAVIIPVDRAGRVLLQLRDRNPAAVYPGEWGLFGGGVEGSETLAGAASRELQEETGLLRPPADFRPFARVVSPLSGRRIFVFELSTDIHPRDIRLGEGAGFAFIEPRDFPRFQILPIARLALEEWMRRRERR